jgi:hypothetical protein
MSAAAIAVTRGRPFTDHLRPRFNLPRVWLGVEMLLHLSLATDKHQLAGVEPSRAPPLLQFATKGVMQQ